MAEATNLKCQIVHVKTRGFLWKNWDLPRKYALFGFLIVLRRYEKGAWSMMVMDHGWWLWTMDDDDGPWMMIMDRGWWLWTMDDGYGDSGSCIHDVWYIQWATLIMSVTMFLSFSQRCTMVCRKARGWSYKPYGFSLFNLYMCKKRGFWHTFL